MEGKEDGGESRVKPHASFKMGAGSSGQDWEKKTYPPAHARVNLGWEEESVGLLDKDFCTYVVVGDDRGTGMPSHGFVC